MIPEKKKKTDGTGAITTIIFFPDEFALRQLMKYLEGQRSHFLSLLANQARKKHRLDLDRQKERDLLEALITKGSLAEILKKGKPKGWNYRQTRYNEPINESPRESERYFWEYSSFKLPYLTREMNEDDGTNIQDDDYGYDQNPPLKHLSYDEINFDRGMKEEEPLEFRGSYEDDRNDVQTQTLRTTTPYFSFDTSLRERHPFAVKPNDPRYYQDGPFFVGTSSPIRFTNLIYFDVITVFLATDR